MDRLYPVATAIAAPILACLIGWGFSAPLRGLDAVERFAVALGTAIALFAGAGFIAFMVGSTSGAAGAIILALLLVSAALVFRISGRSGTACRAVLTVWLLGYVHLVLLQSLLPQYLGSYWYGDWWMHYDESLVFLGAKSVDTVWLGAYSLASRTPLFNLASAFLLSLFGREFWTFQIVSVLLNSCVLLPLYLLSRRLFGERAAALAILLACLDLWMLHEAWYTWPKMLAAFYLLMSLHFYLRWIRSVGEPGANRSLGYAWIAAWLGFMTHQVAGIYLAALVLHSFLLGRRAPVYRITSRHVAVGALAMTLLVGPWFAYLVHHFGIAHTLGSTPLTTMAPERLRLSSMLAAYVGNLCASIVPVYLTDAIVGGPPWRWEAFYHAFTTVYFSSLPGALTISVAAFLLLTWIHRRSRVVPVLPRIAGREEWRAVWLFIVLGAIGATAVCPSKAGHGIAHAVFFPSSILLALLAWGYLAQAPGSVIRVVTWGIVVEFVLMVWSHVWFLNVQPVVLAAGILNQELKTQAQLVFLSDVPTVPMAWRCALAAVVQGVIVWRLQRCVAGEARTRT